MSDFDRIIIPRTCKNVLMSMHQLEALDNQVPTQKNIYVDFNLLWKLN